MPRAHSVGVTRARSVSQSSAVLSSAVSPVRDAASASSGTISDPNPSSIALECSPGGLACGLVSTEGVVEHRLEVCQVGDEPAHPARARLASCGLEQLGRLRLLAAPDREQHVVVQNRLVAGCLGDQAILVEEELRHRQLPGVNEASTEEVEREAQLHERARLAGDL